jgi:hypothetical protein
LDALAYTWPAHAAAPLGFVGIQLPTDGLTLLEFLCLFPFQLCILNRVDANTFGLPPIIPLGMLFAIIIVVIIAKSSWHDFLRNWA